MAMTFNAMFNAIFDQISKRVVETYHPKREDGKHATINDVRVVCDRVMAESFIQITFGGGESKVLHKPEEYKTCTYVLGRGDRAGDACGKKAKSGCDYCGTHAAVAEKAKVKKATCEHIFTKGKTPGSTCTSAASDGSKYCSKHKKKSTTASSESGGEDVVVVVKKPVKVPTAKANSAPEAKAKKAPTTKKSEEFVNADESDDADETMSRGSAEESTKEYNLYGDSNAEDISEDESDLEFEEEVNGE
jgi:hypothetical protein